MNRKIVPSTRVVAAGFLLVATAWWGGCRSQPPSPVTAGAPFESPSPLQPPEATAPAPSARESASIAAEAAWTVVRVANPEVPPATYDGGAWRWDRCSITTPLPVGYPAPTPPGAIELKKYPAVRRAEVSGTMDPDLGMNAGFFPLFRHIQRRGIAMTSPVEMDYHGVSPGRAPEAEGWTMSFLYREPQLGPAGSDGRVAVVDAPPMTVLAIGVRGSYGLGRMQTPMQELEDWLEANPQWQAAGDARALYYNGPDVRRADLWGELHVPVEPSGMRETDR